MISRSETEPLRGSYVEVKYLSRSDVIYCRKGMLKYAGLRHMGIEDRKGFLYRIPVAAIQSVREVQQ